MNFAGILVGLCSFLIIGVFHVVVIKSEYHLGARVWPAFLILGLACVAGALFITDNIISALVAILGFSFFWSIHELFAQKKRVEKGWFPSNPKKQR